MSFASYPTLRDLCLRTKKSMLLDALAKVSEALSLSDDRKAEALACIEEHGLPD